MDQGNFEVVGNPNYPVSTETFDLLQSMIMAVSQLVNFSGLSNFILSGCGKIGNKYNAGWIVIDGELYRFEGGLAFTSGSNPPHDLISIRQISVDAQVYDTLYENVIIKKTAICGSDIGASVYHIDEFTTISTLNGLKQSIDALTVAIADKASVESLDLKQDRMYCRTFDCGKNWSTNTVSLDLGNTSQLTGYILVGSLICADNSDLKLSWHLVDAGVTLYLKINCVNIPTENVYFNYALIEKSIV